MLKIFEWSVITFENMRVFDIYYVMFCGSKHLSDTFETPSKIHLSTFSNMSFCVEPNQGAYRNVLKDCKIYIQKLYILFHLSLLEI